MRYRKLPFILGGLIAPVALYLLFVIGPYAQAFYLALTDWRGLSAQPKFIGLDNFTTVFDDEMFWKALRNHGQLLLAVPLVTIVIALFFAFMLNAAGGRRGAAGGVRGSGLYRVVYFFPQVLSVVVVGVMFQSVYRPDESGILNSLLMAFGVEPIGFLTDPSVALWAIIGAMVWAGVGFYVVLFSAGMASVPQELYEAAALDGASSARTFRSVTLPLLRNTVQVAWVYMGIAALDYFALISVLSVEGGGPDGATTVLGLQVWKNAFEYYKFGYASALGVVLFFIVMTFVALTLRLTKREEIEY